MSKIKKAIHYTQRHQATNESRKNETFLSELTQVRQERIRHQKSLTFRISSVLRSSLVRILSAICNETVVLQLCVKGISDDRNLQARVLERLHQLEYRQFRSKFEEGNNHLRNNHRRKGGADIPASVGKTTPYQNRWTHFQNSWQVKYIPLMGNNQRIHIHG